MAQTWEVTTEDQFLAWYDATVRIASTYARRLCGADRGRAEDLVQDAYVAVLRRVRQRQVTEATVGLVTTTIRHRFVDGVRSAAGEERRLRLLAVTDAPDATDVAAPDAAPAGADVAAGLVELSDRDRLALVLRHVEGLSVAQVAAEMDLSVHATESLLVRARDRARGQLRRHG